MKEKFAGTFDGKPVWFISEKADEFYVWFQELVRIEKEHNIKETERLLLKHFGINEEFKFRKILF